MRTRLAWVLLAASCASPSGVYESEDADAAAIYRSLNGRFPNLPDAVEAAFEGDAFRAADLEAALALFEPLLGELSRAARARRCAWTYAKPPSMTEEYPLDYVLAATKLLRTRARARFEAGAVAAAVEDGIVLCRFGSDLAQDRWVIGRLLGVVASYWGCETVRDCVRSGRLGREALERFEAHLAPLAVRYPPFEVWVRDEKEMALPLLEEIRDEGFSEVIRRVAREKTKGEDPPWLLRRWEDWFREAVRKDPERVRRHVSRRWDACLAPVWAALGEPLNSEALTRALEEIRKGQKALSERMARQALGFGAGDEQALTDAADLVFALWVPALGKLARHHANAGLLLETTRLACRLELHRLARGHYPGSLAEVGEDRPDPYDGGRLKYRRVVSADGEGYVVTAAGPKADAEQRIRVLAEECGFDKVLYERRGYGDTDFFTFGVLRR